MNFWMLIAIILHTGGIIAFGGGLLWFTLVLGRAERANGLEGARIADDTFRVTSIGMSVGLTALLAGGLLRQYLVQGHFAWSTQTLYDTLFLLKCLVLLIEWVAWGVFEVVIMHELRIDVPTPGGEPSPRHIRARARARRALRGQLALFFTVLLLGAAAQAARAAGG